MGDFFMTTGQKIKDLRKQSKFTQKMLAEKLGCSQNRISDLENDAYEPDMGTLDSICKIFGVPGTYFIEGDFHKNNVTYGSVIARIMQSTNDMIMMQQFYSLPEHTQKSIADIIAESAKKTGV